MAEEYQYRTAITRLELTASEKAKLRELIEAWKSACGIAADIAWPNTESKRALQSAAYDRIREETGLKSQHAILVCHRVAETMTSLVQRRKKGQKVSKPTFRSPTVTFGSRTMTLSRDGAVSLSTLKSRVEGHLALPTESDGYQYQYLSNDEWEVTESTLSYREGGFYLHIGFR